MRIIESWGGRAVGLALCIALAACGRSEDVGWEGGQPPDSAERAARAEKAREALEQSPMGEQIRVRSYEQLAKMLEPLQKEAMEDPEIAAMWERLASDVEASIVSESAFHRKLLERRDEIESLIGEDVESPDSLTEEQRAELARHHWNIQVELARVRNMELRQPQFFPRLREFRDALFDKMRELAPSRSAEITRMQELEENLVQPHPETPFPGLTPQR